MTYIVGTIITIVSCFPCVQGADAVLTYLGLMVAGMGAVGITEHFIFPKIGYTRYWNLYRKNDINWAALVSWGLSLAFFLIMLATRPIHQNFWFIPTFLIAVVSYIILAGMMGAKEKYPEEEKEELAYEKALQDYVDEQTPAPSKEAQPLPVKVISAIGYAALAVMLIAGCVFFTSGMTTELMKTVEFALTIVYFVCALLKTVLSR